MRMCGSYQIQHVQQFNGCQLFKEEQNTGVELFVPGAGEEEELTCVIYTYYSCNYLLILVVVVFYIVFPVAMSQIKVANIGSL